jgi:hypothetical protein
MVGPVDIECKERALIIYIYHINCIHGLRKKIRSSYFVRLCNIERDHLIVIKMDRVSKPRGNMPLAVINAAIEESQAGEVAHELLHKFDNKNKIESDIYDLLVIEITQNSQQIDENAIKEVISKAINIATLLINNNIMAHEYATKYSDLIN